jgi:hypothetical protein
MQNELLPHKPRRLHVGDLVEVLSPQEILATLDEHGELESLPFMPEMLQFCGKRFRVDKVAVKACDTITSSGMYRMHNAVHLSNSRCDGSAHGGCQAACNIYWKEAWLRKTEGPETINAVSQEPGQARRSVRARSVSPVVCTIKTLSRATQNDVGSVPRGNPCYACQATELLRAAPERIASWNANSYVRDLRSGNVGGWAMFVCLLIGAFNEAQDVIRRLLPERLSIPEGGRFPFIKGKLHKTPEATLELRPGELVRIKSKEEIVGTLDVNNRNRGMLFDAEMLRYCGREARVRQRVEKIIDEKTGRMIHFKNSCIMLEDVTCTGRYHRYCPRGIYPYWREIWLERVVPTAGIQPSRPHPRLSALVARSGGSRRSAGRTRTRRREQRRHQRRDRRTVPGGDRSAR